RRQGLRQADKKQIAPARFHHAAMEKQIIADEKVYLGHFYESERHTIQIDFNKYVSDLKKELRGNWIAAE
ncbi:hypothetical protein N9Z39_04780, partial [Alphaproteobacteria bacterium]|nr:hypothetical protein [Alphaproteobacteria bacterium]